MKRVTKKPARRASKGAGKRAGGQAGPAISPVASREKVLSALREALKSAGGEAELVYIAHDSGTTRFAASGIHQNMSERGVSVSARVAVGKKLGVASVNSLAKGELVAALKRAREIANSSKPLAEFPGFPGPQTYGPAPHPDPAIVGQAPAERADALKPLFAAATKSRTELHGALIARTTQLAVANTSGLTAFHEGTLADAQFIAMDAGIGGSGYSADAAPRWDGIDLPTLADMAIRKCVDSRKPRDLDPGTYEVILEPAAVAEIFSWLPWIAFTGRSVEDGQSFLKDKFGQMVATDAVTIYDDGLDSEGIPLPFDFEGRPKKSVYFIDRGVAREVAHDVVSAANAKARPTGHAPFPGMGVTAMPLNLFVAPGMSSVEEMIAQTHRGVLVTRFHYLNGLLNPPIALFTGMTRDGAFWVEDGKVRHPIKNMRFTQSIAKALHGAELVGRDRTITPNTWASFGSACVPAMKFREWVFSSKTEF
ncbi:MAG: metallopeptidase TldD-related protein [Planctomycetota bacterium]